MRNIIEQSLTRIYQSVHYLHDVIIRDSNGCRVAKLRNVNELEIIKSLSVYIRSVETIWTYIWDSRLQKQHIFVNKISQFQKNLNMPNFIQLDHWQFYFPFTFNLKQKKKWIVLPTILIEDFFSEIRKASCIQWNFFAVDIQKIEYNLPFEKKEKSFVEIAGFFFTLYEVSIIKKLKFHRKY